MIPANKARGHPLHPAVRRPGQGRDLRAAMVLSGLGSVRPSALPRPLLGSSGLAEPGCPYLTGKEKVQVLLPGAAVAKRDGNRLLRALPAPPCGAAARRPAGGVRPGPGQAGEARGTANMARAGGKAASAAQLPAEEKFKEVFMNHSVSQMESPEGTYILETKG